MVQELLSYNLLLDYFWHGVAGERAPPRAVSRGAQGSTQQHPLVSSSLPCVESLSLIQLHRVLRSSVHDHTGHYVCDCRLLKDYKKKIGWKSGTASSQAAKRKGLKEK